MEDFLRRLDELYTELAGAGFTHDEFMELLALVSKHYEVRLNLMEKIITTAKSRLDKPATPPIIT